MSPKDDPEERKLAPRKTPCATCPYRKNVPQGIWDWSEYQKLRRYDEDTATQPPNLFMCHQGEGDICMGWWSCGGQPFELLAVRLAVIRGEIALEELENITTIPIHPTHSAAAGHGTEKYYDPPQEARDAIEKIVRKRNL